MAQIRGSRVDLAPIVKTTSAQSVARQILAMVREGAWVAGDRLPTEKDLCERLAVGRSTIREALQILATLNIVQPMPGQGTFIKAPTTADMLRADLIGFLIGRPDALALLEAREMIEPPVARLSCLRGTKQDFDAIEDLLDRHATAHAAGQPVSEYAARFHVLLAEASHNPVAVIFMTSILELLMQRGRRFDDFPDFQAREIAQHRSLLATVRRGDPDRAAEEMVRHIVESAATYDRPERNPATRSKRRATA